MSSNHDEYDVESLLRVVKSLKATLTQVNYQNQMMLRWVNGAVINLDKEGMVLQANEAALHSLRWNQDEFIGCHMHETIQHSQEDGSEYPWEFSPVFAAIEDGSSHHVDGEVFWQKDGASFSADYIVCPTRDDNNEITGAVLTFRNLTEQSIEEAKRIHEMKLASIGELAAGIAHEINTPVQFIGSNVFFLQECFESILELLPIYQQGKEVLAKNQAHKELLARIEEMEEEVELDYLMEEGPKAFTQTQNGVERVTDLILGLKSFAHAGDGDKKKLSDINTIIVNTLTVCHNAYKYVAELETNLADDLPMVPVLPGDISQVLVNLVVNAAHAIEENKERLKGMGKITITTAQEDEMLIVSVADTGAGIPKQVQQRIFDPFFTTKQVGRGSGQGLAISRTIVHDRHQGELSFNSTVGEGTTFTMRLPMGPQLS